jgi:hypothetical protein
MSTAVIDPAGGHDPLKTINIASLERVVEVERIPFCRIPTKLFTVPTLYKVRFAV